MAAIGHKQDHAWHVLEPILNVGSESSAEASRRTFPFGSSKRWAEATAIPADVLLSQWPVSEPRKQ
jgi:hypothetical protein